MTRLNPEETAIVATVRDFVDREVMPQAHDLERANTYPESLIEQMKGLGIFGLMVPEPYGDAPVSTVCFALVTEELSRGWMSLSGAMGGHSVVSRMLAVFGTQEQKDRYLPGMSTGKIRAAMALTEPSGGSDLQSIRTVARLAGSGYVISGSKTWITNARRCQLIALLCKTDPEAVPRHGGISIMLVEQDAPGLTVFA